MVTKIGKVVHRDGVSLPRGTIADIEYNRGDVINTFVQTVKLIQARGLYHREFQACLSDVDTKYLNVLYHWDVRWPSLCGSQLLTSF